MFAGIRRLGHGRLDLPDKQEQQKKENFIQTHGVKISTKMGNFFEKKSDTIPNWEPGMPE
jgi:hypothetical protein